MISCSTSSNNCLITCCGNLNSVDISFFSGHVTFLLLYLITFKNENLYTRTINKLTYLTSCTTWLYSYTLYKYTLLLTTTLNYLIILHTNSVVFCHWSTMSSSEYNSWFLNITYVLLDSKCRNLVHSTIPLPKRTKLLKMCINSAWQLVIANSLTNSKNWSWEDQANRQFIHGNRAGLCPLQSYVYASILNISSNKTIRKYCVTFFC